MKMKVEDLQALLKLSDPEDILSKIYESEETPVNLKLKIFFSMLARAAEAKE